MATRRRTPPVKRPKDEGPFFDLGAALGASGASSEQLLQVYIPNKDKHGREFRTQRRWVLEAADLLARVGGGVTILPPAEGGWLNEAEGKIVWEAPVVVYTYIKGERFLESLPKLRHLLHRMGRETNQGEVVVEFDGVFFRITEPFDPKS
jgi:hypothetical protein